MKCKFKRKHSLLHYLLREKVTTSDAQVLLLLLLLFLRLSLLTIGVPMAHLWSVSSRWSEQAADGLIDLLLIDGVIGLPEAERDGLSLPEASICLAPVESCLSRKVTTAVDKVNR